MPLHEKSELSDDFAESETLSSVLSYEGDPRRRAAAGWHTEEGQKRSEDIDRYLEAESTKLQRQLKILVLGHNEPKDVFWKRANLLENPLTAQDRSDMKSAITQSVFGIARQVADQLLSEVEKLEPLDHEEQAAANRLREILEHEGHDFEQGLHAFCTDGDLREKLASHNLTVDNVASRLLTSWYAMYRNCSCAEQSAPLTNLLQRVLSSDYIPTDHDYIHFDNRRTHSYLREAHLSTDTHVLRILDLHPGRGERKKWIHLFEDMRCVIFVADLASYVNYEEDHDSSPLQESLVLFESIARSRWFRETPLICVLCNADAFKGLLKDHPLKRWLPAYEGHSDEEAVELVLQRFTSAAGGRKDLQIQVCDELDESAVKAVFETMEGKSLRTILDKLGEAGSKTG